MKQRILPKEEFRDTDVRLIYSEKLSQGNEWLEMRADNEIQGK